MIDVWRLRVLVQIDLCTDDTFQFAGSVRKVIAKLEQLPCFYPALEPAGGPPLAPATPHASPTPAPHPPTALPPPRRHHAALSPRRPRRRSQAPSTCPRRREAAGSTPYSTASTRRAARERGAPPEGRGALTRAVGLGRPSSSTISSLPISPHISVGLRAAQSHISQYLPISR